ncbi:MAG: hypothetical protein K2N53_03285, partial [Clostridia bacterium]|nr:hypothetical protein [Clostridia bacterium]
DLIWGVSTSQVFSSKEVLTLMLYNHTEEVQFNSEYYNASTTSKYPSALYSTSTIRNITLNAGGYYTPDGANLTKALQSQDNAYAKFTMKDIDESLTDYIVQPKYVKYQAEETWNVSGNLSSSICPNESYVYDANGKYNGSAKAFCQNERYSDWKDDYIWLPSLTEAAPQNTSAPVHDLIWGVSTSQVFSSKEYWLRCIPAASGSGGIEHTMSSSAWSQKNTNATGIYARPCLHLNLTAAEAHSAIFINAPEQVSSVYNANEQTIVDAEGIEEKSWYDEAIYGDASKMSIEYFDSNGDPLPDKYPKYVGTYTVKYTIVGKEKYAWSGSSGINDNVRTSTFVIRKKQVDFPRLYNNESSKVYNGGNNINFRVAIYDKDALMVKFNDNEIPANNTVSVQM